MNVRWRWLHRIALAIDEAEKPAAREKVESSLVFKKDVDKAIKLHRSIARFSDRRRLYYEENRTYPAAIIGNWSPSDDIKGTVVEMPFLHRRADLEKELRALGKLIGYPLGGLFLSVGPGRDSYRLIWYDDDSQEIDISLEDDLKSLLLELRTESATIERFKEVLRCLEAGQIPSQPS